jgi:hypothetical protein
MCLFWVRFGDHHLLDQIEGLLDMVLDHIVSVMRV